jgi:hypothetical protein
MSKKSDYIEAVKRSAYFEQLKNALDENTGAKLTKMSTPDYLRMIINEGVLSEPPTPPDYSNLTKANSKSLNAASDAWAKWEQSALSKIKEFGVTSSSLTPGYDQERGIFTDIISNGGGGFAGFSGLVVAPKEEGGEYLSGGLNSLMGLDYSVAGSGDNYESPWSNLSGFNWLSRYSRDNGQLSDEDYLQSAYQKAYARQEDINNNVWGPASSYEPIPFWGTTISQKDARKMKAYAKKDLSEYTLEEFKKDFYYDEWQQARHQLGLSSDIKNKTSAWPNSIKNATKASEVPDISTIDAYLANKDKFDAMGAYAAMIRGNKNLFKSGTGEAKDGADLGFSNFTEWYSLSPEQQELADNRTKVYEDYYAAKAAEEAAKKAYESSEKKSGIKSFALGAILSVATGGIFAASGLSSAISSSLGGAISSGVVTGAAAGAAGGAVRGGLEGALKGALVGGIGAGIGESLTGGIAGDAASLENQFYSDTANLFGDAITPESFLPNLGSDVVSGAITGSGSGLLSQFEDDTNQAFSDAITPDSISTGGTSSDAPSGTDQLADQVGDEVASQLEGAMNNDDNQSSNNNSGSSNQSSSDSTVSDQPVITATGGIFGNKRVKGVGFEYRSSSQPTTPNYNSGIRLNSIDSGGLLDQQQGRV